MVEQSAGQQERKTPMHVLFLQGPTSFYMEQVARQLIARGHRASRINLHFGDRLFWRLPARNYRGSPQDWRAYIARFLDANPITHLFLLGDRRPYHRVAIEEARGRGAEIICSELGYLRPDWLVLERDGMSTYSRMPREADTIRSLAQRFDEPDLSIRCTTPFWRLAVTDIVYTIGEVFFRLHHPRYKRHAIYHPFAEYAGWIKRWLLSPLEKRRTARALAALNSTAAPTFIFPLQLSTDFQIRDHSPYPDMPAAAADVIASFARHAPAMARLVVKVHPLDSGLTAWRPVITEMAERHGVGDRVFYVDGGDIGQMLVGSAGCVLVNSTVGLFALQRGCPLKVLGNAIFDVPGMTFQGPLDAFWSQATPPDMGLVGDFVRLLAGAIHIRGGYYTKQALDMAVPATVQRLEDGLPWLPSRSATEPSGNR